MEVELLVKPGNLTKSGIAKAPNRTSDAGETFKLLKRYADPDYHNHLYQKYKKCVIRPFS